MYVDEMNNLVMTLRSKTGTWYAEHIHLDYIHTIYGCRGLRHCTMELMDVLWDSDR